MNSEIRIKSFFFGFITALVLVVMGGGVYFLFNTKTVRVAAETLGENDMRLSPPPQIFSVVDQADEIIIKGVKFGPKGKVCVGASQVENFSGCQEITVITWGSSSIRAKRDQVGSSGENVVWLISADGLESNKFEF